jgi:hypothetical protein
LTAAHDLPFDRVVVIDQQGQTPMPVDGFLALPIHRRVQYVLGGRIEFFSGLTMIDRQVALRALMDLSKR